MINKEGIRQNWRKAESQLREAKRFLDEDQPDEALYFIWLAAENIVNSLKVGINGFYLKEHEAKSSLLKDYFATDVLRKDYSKAFEQLSRYRIAAGFHPYTSVPKDYTREDVLNFLLEIQKLKKEAEGFLGRKGVLK
jgi:HEPN domain-containing protein